MSDLENTVQPEIVAITLGKEPDTPCRDCDGSGLFYQIEDCKCWCQMSSEELYEQVK